MSTINSITSTVISAFQGVTPTAEVAPVEAPANNAPAFQETLTTQGRAFALGLGVPRNHGDIEAVFAEIATKFGVEVAKANDFATAAQTAVRSTALAAASGSLAFFATYNVIMLNSEANIRNQNGIIAAKGDEIKDLEAQKAPLVAQRDTLNAEYTANANAYWQNVNQINTLNAQLSTVEPARAQACGADAGSASCLSLTSQANGIRSQISSLEGQNANLVTRNNQIVGQVATLNDQINILQSQIDTATGERNAAISSRDQSELDYDAALAALNTYAAVLIPFTVALALGQVGAAARASFDLGPDQSGFDTAIAQAVNRLADLSDDMGNLSMIRQALAQAMPSAPDMIAVDTDVGAPGGGGQEPPVTPPVTPTTTGAAPEQPVQDAPVQDETNLDVIPGTAPLPTPQVPPTEGVATDPQVAAVDPTARQSTVELLRQLLTNLPLPTGDLFPDPMPTGEADGAQPGQPGRPQSSFDVVRQLLQDMLPPAVGNAEEVASRTGELAAALAMLRGALAQVAQSEAAQTPQVPGASGRLTLAI